MFELSIYDTSLLAVLVLGAVYVTWYKQKCYQEAELLKVFRALLFATEKHRKQKRKCKEEVPYIEHPIKVATYALQACMDEKFNWEDRMNTVCAALLHDTVEDTDCTFDELVKNFGPDVAMYVNEVTDDKSLPKEERKQKQIEHAPHCYKQATVVKLADKMANNHDLMKAPVERGIPTEWTVERIQKYFEWSCKVVGALKNPPKKLLKQFYDLFNNGDGEFTYLDGKKYPTKLTKDSNGNEQPTTQ